MGISVAVVGATGNVGREILNILSDRQFPFSRIAAIASRKSVGSEISFAQNYKKALIKFINFMCINTCYFFLKRLN